MSINIKRLLQHQPTHKVTGQRPFVLMPVCSTMLSVRRVNQKKKKKPPWASWDTIIQSHKQKPLCSNLAECSLASTGNMRLWACGSPHHVFCRWIHAFVRREVRLESFGFVKFLIGKITCVFLLLSAIFIWFEWNLSIAEQLYKIPTFSAEDSIWKWSLNSVFENVPDVPNLPKMFY